MSISIAQRQNLIYVFLLILATICSIFFYHHTQQKWLYFGKAEHKFLKKEFVEAIPLYRESISLGFTNDYAFFHLASALVATGNFSESIYWYKVYLNKHPNDISARFELAKALTWNGNLQEAEHEYQKLREQGYDKE